MRPACVLAVALGPDTGDNHNHNHNNQPRETDMRTLTIHQHVVNASVQGQLPALLRSRPGVGKTAFLQMLARSLGLRYQLISSKDPTFVGGMPHVTHIDRPEGPVPVVRRTPAEEFLKANWAWEDDKEATLFVLEEIANIPASIRDQYLMLVQSHVAGNLSLYPEACHFVGAFNPPESAPRYHSFSEAEATRWLWTEWDTAGERQAWRDGMTSGWPDVVVPVLPPEWKHDLGVGAALVARFDEKCPNAGHSGYKWSQEAKMMVPISRDGLMDKPTGNDRTLDMAARAWAVSEHYPISDNKRTALRAMMFKGILGEGLGTEFLTFVEVADQLPMPREILADVAGHTFPSHDRPDLQYLESHGVFAYMASRLRATRDTADLKADWEASFWYLKKVHEAGCEELALAGCRNFLRKDLVIPLAPPAGTLGVVGPLLKALKNFGA